MAITLESASNRWINIGTSKATLQNVAAATTSIWVKPASTIGSGTRGVTGFSTGTSDTNPRCSLEQTSSGWQIVARRLDADSTQIAGGGSVTVGTVYHLVGVTNYAGGHLKLYINGAIVTTTNVAGWTANTSNKTSNNSSLGAEEDGGSSWFDGTIDDARIYTRALSAQEIENLYNARGADSIVNGLVHRWKMNESYPTATASGASSVKDTAGTIHITPTASPVYAEALVRSTRRRRR